MRLRVKFITLYIWCWYKDKQMNRIERLQVGPHIHSQLVFNKDAKIIKLIFKNSLKQRLLEQSDIQYDYCSFRASFKIRYLKSSNTILLFQN